MNQTAAHTAAATEQASAALGQAFKGNAPASQVYLHLRMTFAQHIVRAARCTLQRDAAGSLAALQDAATTERTARALLLGLGIQADLNPKAANAAAHLRAGHDFMVGQLVTAASAEPRAVYVDDAPADPETLSAAPERVIWSEGGRTAYLYTVSDHRRHCQRTGRTPQPLPLH